ncbi:BrxA/BrxB family bacilliredoxin [uncultured Apibacter sp.]|uniref:BrxA/BrxB family bacilliredoxin n=1 Tax=uncultured Apibacter sp. TaxID=1778616 RepID=UPI0025E6D39A|nr:BrxA/BrxB family bacilliredoxin [uncultured Apibacter sp.]
MYPEEMVAPMKAQLTNKGFEDLNTSEKVLDALKKPGTTLLIINSVCGCAAGGARPGVLLSVEGEGKKPDHLTTAFAGFDVEAVKTAREHLAPFPPSSPSIALFKDGELVHFLERHHIEGHSPELIAENLKQAYAEFC